MPLCNLGLFSCHGFKLRCADTFVIEIFFVIFLDQIIIFIHLLTVYTVPQNLDKFRLPVILHRYLILICHGKYFFL